MLRSRAIPAIALVLAITAIGITVTLQRKESDSRNSQLSLQSVKLELSKLQAAPFSANASTGGSPELARGLMQESRGRIAQGLDSAGESPAALDGIQPLMSENNATLDRIYALGASGVGYEAEADRLAGEASDTEAQIVSLLDEASGEFDDRAASASTRATIGDAGAILFLLGAFCFYYRRSLRTALTNRRMLAEAREESLTDALTELGNRRALINDLEAGVTAIEEGRQLMLALFDLDGFKQYNDTFGHPAGDSLLRRLGLRLRTVGEGRATAYRMGGDEFCLLAQVEPGEAEEITSLAIAALTESGRGFRIDCSHGSALIPSEATDTEGALSLADGRMYEQKAELDSAGRQSSDVLLSVLAERDPALGAHLSSVATLAEQISLQIGLSAHQAKRIHMAAELHDVGKTGIPDSITEKPGPLDEDETEFMQRHSLIGERILRAASSLAPAAGLVRSHHERMDGNGYPDGLEGERIPIGARIIFAADAFDAMTSARPYREAISVADALDELRDCAGTQFDPRVVEAIVTVVEAAPARPDDQPLPVASVA